MAVMDEMDVTEQVELRLVIFNFNNVIISFFPLGRWSKVTTFISLSVFCTHIYCISCLAIIDCQAGSDVKIELCRSRRMLSTEAGGRSG